MRFVTLFLCLGLLCGGCSIFSSLPSKLLGKKQAQIDKIDKKADANEQKQLEAAKGFTWGANYSLSLSPNRNSDPYIGLAYDMTGRALQITGNPSVEEAKVFKDIVVKSTSTNRQDQLDAERLLASKDLAIIELQSKYNKLQADKEVAEEKYKEAAKEGSRLGDIYASVRRWFMIFVYGVIAIFVIRIIAIFVPPPYSALMRLPELFFGGLFKIGTKLMPDVKRVAGVVSEETHQLSEATLTAVIHAIQQAKDTDASGLIAEALEPHLKDKTSDDSTRIKINEIKTKLKNEQKI